MDRYMGLLRWSLIHRWKTMLIGVAAFVATIFAFGTLPFTFQPNVNSDFTSVAVEMAPGSTLQQTAARRQPGRRHRPQGARRAQGLRLDPGRRRQHLHHPERRSRADQHRVRARRRRPSYAEIADARVYFRSQQGFGNRDVSIMLVRRRSGEARAGRQAIVQDMKKLPEVKAPRIEGDLQAARDHDQAALRPRRRHGRHHRRAQPDDPDRDPGRDRPEQRQILAVRPADPDPGLARTRNRARTSRPSRICRCRRPAAARCR